jgi:hypothetical protein
VLRDCCTEDAQARLIDNAGFLSCFHARWVNRVGARVHLEQHIHDAFVPPVFSQVDLGHEAVDFIGLKEHGGAEQQAVFDALAAGEGIAKTLSHVSV